jgi:CRISPR-associated protein Cmr6
MREPRALRDNLKEVAVQPSTHAGLWLDRFLGDLDASGAKQAHLSTLSRIQVPAGYPAFFRRWKTALEALPDTLLAKAVVRGRMAVGLGAESVLETSVSLHRTYGLPYLPGSGLKGLAAAAAHRHLADPAWRKATGGNPIGPSHRLLFGEQELSGHVTFHDALWWPESGNGLPLDLDVMTVHHSDYYLGKNVPPADWDNPVPVPFASMRGAYLLALTGPSAWVKAAYDILKDALDQDGAGAKTAAGYGRMEVTRLASSSPAAIDWEPRVRLITIGNAAHEVPRLLRDLQGGARRLAAQALLKKLADAARKRGDQPWVQELRHAAE